jgi:hypothetical protein
MTEVTDRSLPRAARIALAAMFVLSVVLPVAVGALDRGDMRCVREGALVRCEYVESLFGVERCRRRIEDVIGARLDYSPAKKGTGTYRAVLLTRAGEVPLSRSFNYNRERSDVLAGRVARFVEGGDSTLAFSQAGWGWTLVLGATAFLVALTLAIPRLSKHVVRS